MIRLLEVPGWKTLEEFDVVKFPTVRPVAGELVHVWAADGGFRGTYRARDDGIDGVRLVSVVSGVVITSNDNHVYWTTMKSAMERKQVHPGIETISPDDIKPGDKIEMFDGWWNVRYINYYVRSKRFQLQREEDEIHPLCDKTCMTVEINDGLQLRIKRVIKGGRNA